VGARAVPEPVLAATLLLLAFLGPLSCDETSRRGDTTGVQSYGRWEWHARLVVAPDPTLTLVRMRIDTSRGGGDVVLARYDFDPSVGVGDEYALTLGLDIGNVRALRPGAPVAIGAPSAPIPAFATVTCFCPPLRPDSVRGTLTLATRGLRQLTGRVDATLYFSRWDDSTRRTAYQLHQRIDAIK